MSGSDRASVLCHTMPAADTGVVTYDDPEGLSRSAILALAHDARGYLWIGAERGPMRFDGMEWCTPTGLAPLSTYDTWALDAREPDAVWVGTSGAGLWRMEMQETSCRCAALLTRADGLPDDDVHALCRDGAGALWVGTHHGLAVVDGQRVASAWTTDDGIPEAGVCALCADSADGAWAGSLRGLMQFNRCGPRAHLTTHDGLPDDAVYALCVDAGGHVWAGTRHGIAIIADGRVRATICEGLPSPEVRALCLDRDGRMWAGTAKGLARIEGHAVRACWTRAEHLPSSSVWALHCDAENRLWVGTESGLALLPQENMPARTRPLGRDADGGVFAFAADRRGQTWIGTAAGLMTVAADGQTPVAPPSLPPLLEQGGVWVAYRDAAGAMWVGGRYGGLYCLDPVTGEPCAHIAEVDAARCAVGDSDGRLWVGTLGAGLACVDMERGVLLHRLTVAQGLPCDHVSSLCLDGRGRLWAATLGGGLACIDRHLGAVTRVCGDAEGLPHLTVSALALGTGDQMWGATRGGGLFLFDLARDCVDGVWTVADGLPSDTLVSCAVDDGGALWLGTARGLARYRPSEGTWLALGRPHGLPGESCQEGALWLDEHGRLWVGTAEGVAVVTPHGLPRSIPPCVVYLTGLRVMGQEREAVAGLEIEDSDYDLVIDYGAVAFVAAAQVMYRTQLVGLESGWSRPHAHRFARYTNLSPGDYTFRVAARNWGGQWSAPCEWRFRVVRNAQAEELARTQQRAEMAEAAVHVRNEVLRAVAHDLRTPLTGIIGHADLLRARLERDTPPPGDWLRIQASALQAGAWRMAAMVDELMDVVHLQMGQRLTLQITPVDVSALVRTVAAPLANSAEGQDRLCVDTPPSAMVEGDRARLARVAENLIGNALKYSSATSPVCVMVRAEEDEVRILVRDSGVGIPASELPHIFTPYYRASTSSGIPGTGLGLAGARAIVEQHGGSIMLESRAGEGTVVTVSLPRRAASS